MATIDELRNAYRDTYREYAVKFGSFQRIRESKCASPNDFNTAASELDKARVRWNAARDRLAGVYKGTEVADPELTASVGSGR